MKLIKNIIKWFKILKNDDDFDYHYLYKVMDFKINDIANHVEKHRIHVNWKTDVQKMRTCSRLLKRVSEEYYAIEYTDYIKHDFKFEKMEDKEGYSLLKTELISDNLNEFFIKYNKPEYTVLLTDKERTRAALNMCNKRQQKAQDLLFKMLNRYINHWWC